MDDNKLWKTLKEMGISDHLTCFLRNLYAGQEATEPDMEQCIGSKLGKEYSQKWSSVLDVLIEGRVGLQCYQEEREMELELRREVRPREVDL